MFQKLIDDGLVNRKSYDNGLSVFKYSRKVFYEQLWNEDPLLLEARGLVLDENNEKVIWPFTKVFNYGENGTTCDINTQVQMIDKINGFMAGARYYKGEVIVSTTGTLDSDFVTLAKKNIQKHCSLDYPFWHANAKFTLLFEICDESDPHIVYEKPGAYLIGARNMSTGKLESEEFLDWLASRSGFYRPIWGWTTFENVLKDVKNSRREGYMIRDQFGETLMKIKTPFYLGKKFLMRMGDGKVSTMFDNPSLYKETIDEEFYDVIDFITTTFTKEEWSNFDDQYRRQVIEEYFKNG